MRAITAVELERSCKVCGVKKPISEFTPTGHYKSGIRRHHIYCKPCYSSWKRRQYHKNPEKEAARAAEYNKRKPEMAAASMRRYRQRSPDRARAVLQEWQRNNPERVRDYDRASKARRRGDIEASSDPRLGIDWGRILEDHGNRCVYCGMGFLPLTLDHFIPLVRGGRHEPGNVVPACGSCNSRKSSIDPFEFARRTKRPIPKEHLVLLTERQIQSAILIAVTALPKAIFWRSNTGAGRTKSGEWVQFGLIGSPDIIGAYNGRFVGIEVKTEKGQQSLQQRRFQYKFEHAGGIYLVCRCADDALRGLAALDALQVVPKPAAHP